MSALPPQLRPLRQCLLLAFATKRSLNEGAVLTSHVNVTLFLAPARERANRIFHVRPTPSILFHPHQYTLIYVQYHELSTTTTAQREKELRQQRFQEDDWSRHYWHLAFHFGQIIDALHTYSCQECKISSKLKFQTRPVRSQKSFTTSRPTKPNTRELDMFQGSALGLQESCT